MLDGFGIGRNPAGDAIAAAPMPTWRGLLARWPHSTLEASEEAVGLPPGQMGNSEVGHLNLGAGRPVLQDLPRIDAAIADGSFDTRPAFLAAMQRARDGGGVLHVITPDRPGRCPCQRSTSRRARQAGRGARASRALPSMRCSMGVTRRRRRRLAFMRDLEARLAAVHPGASIASVGGRYYAMDRDRRWERTERGYDAIVHGEAAHHAPSATAAIEAAYARGETDEFVAPTVIDGHEDAARRPTTRSSTSTSGPTGPGS